ncbi:unnamed protein product [Calypogeia fissa]
MLLIPKGVRNIRESVNRRKVNYSTKNHLAVRTWVSNKKEKVFLYEEKKSNPDTPLKSVMPDEHVSFIHPETPDAVLRVSVRTKQKDGSEDYDKDCCTCTCGHSIQRNTCGPLLD